MRVTAKPIHDQPISADSTTPVKTVVEAKALAPDALKRLPEETVRFLNSLPLALNLTETAIRYPHIVNKLCLLWYSPRELNAYLTDLLFTERSDRQGLALDSAQELATMREHVLDDLRKQRRGASPL